MSEQQSEELSVEWEYIQKELGEFLNKPFAWIASELEKSIKERRGDELLKGPWKRVKTVSDIAKFLDNNSMVRFPK